MSKPNVLADIRVFIRKIADGEGDSQVLAQEALALIDQALAGSDQQPQRGQPDVQYVVEPSVNGMVLSERRKGGKAFPFRCPETVYIALSQILTKKDRALPLDELVTAVAEALGDAPPDYQVRVPLRLWMQVQPPLLIRNRARYRPVDASTFAATATALWNGLRK